MRKKRNYKREHAPDLKYQNVVVGRFINYVMKNGKKSIAEGIVYDAFAQLEKKGGEDAVALFEKALQNIYPMVEVSSRRIGGANYQVPRPVRPERQYMLAVRWVIEAATGKKGKPLADRLADELLAAAKNEGSAIKKKLDMHRMAEANRAFAHFGW
jgi:small subunit ribosomal protein S7